MDFVVGVTGKGAQTTQDPRVHIPARKGPGLADGPPRPAWGCVWPITHGSSLSSSPPTLVLYPRCI